MPDFQTQKSEMTEKLSELLSQAQDTYAGLQGMKNEYVRVQQRILELWNQLFEAKELFVELLASKQGEFFPEIDLAFQALAQLKDQFAISQETLSQELELTREAVTAIDAQITEIDINIELQEAVESLQTLKNTEVGTDTLNAMGSAKETLGGFEVNLSSFQAELKEETTGLQTEVDTTVGNIEFHTTALSNLLDGLKNSFSEKTSTASDDIDTATKDLMGRVDEAQNYLFDTPDQEVDELSKFLEELEATFNTSSDKVLQSCYVLRNKVSETNEACQSAVDNLNKLVDSWENTDGSFDI